MQDSGSGRVAIGTVRVDAFQVPTDRPEADGTHAWDSTTLVVVRVEGGGRTGLGYTYAHRCVADLVRHTLAPLAQGRDAMSPTAVYRDAVASLRNAGYPGAGAMAVSALDVALWDLKARLLECPLADLFGVVHARVPVYGSGGFTSDGTDRLQAQLAGWVGQGLERVKMKVGSVPADDPARVAAARAAIGPDTALMVDANGAYAHAEAVAMAERFAGLDVDWFEEPVSSDDLAGLRRVRDACPPGMEVTAGEYGWDGAYFLRMLAAQAVDVLQADATRCGGYSGFREAAAIAAAHAVPLSAHCAPALHVPVCAATPGLRHLEWFHDHVRIESVAFDGCPLPRQGAVAPTCDRPGHGLSLRESDLSRYRV